MIYTLVMGLIWLAMAVFGLVIQDKVAFWGALVLSGVWLAAREITRAVNREKGKK